MKTKLIAAAAALVAATAGISLIGTSSAGTPKLKLYFDCFGDFTKSGEANNYACSKNFLIVCKQGFESTKPILTQLGPKKWKVSYGCYKPPA